MASIVALVPIVSHYEKLIRGGPNRAELGGIVVRHAAAYGKHIGFGNTLPI